MEGWRQRLKYFAMMAGAVLLATFAVIGIQRLSDIRHTAAEIAALAQDR